MVAIETNPSGAEFERVGKPLADWPPQNQHTRGINYGPKITDKLIITIDGQAGSGKSSAGRVIAYELGLPMIDAGHVFRRMAMLLLGEGVDPKDEAAVGKILERAQLVWNGSRKDIALELDRKPYNPTEAVRVSEDLGRIASSVSRYFCTREFALTSIRNLGRDGCVAIGREMGIAAFPEARHKFYLIADSELRAERRSNQTKGISVSDAKVSLDTRDLHDLIESGVEAALIEQAVTIDTGHRSIDDTFRLVKSLVTATEAHLQETHQQELTHFVQVGSTEAVSQQSRTFLTPYAFHRTVREVRVLHSPDWASGFNDPAVESLYYTGKRPEYAPLLGLWLETSKISGAGTLVGEGASLTEALRVFGSVLWAKRVVPEQIHIAHMLYISEVGRACLSGLPVKKIRITTTVDRDPSDLLLLTSQAMHIDGGSRLILMGRQPMLFTDFKNVKPAQLEELSRLLEFEAERASRETLAKTTSDWSCVLKDPLRVGCFEPYSVVLMKGKKRPDGHNPQVHSGANYNLEPYQEPNIITFIDFELAPAH